MKEQWRGRRVSSSDQLNQISLEAISEDLESKKFLCYENIFTMTKKKRSTLIGKWEAIQTHEAQHTEWKGGKAEWRNKAREVSLEVRSHSRVWCNQGPGLSIFMHCVWDTHILHITHAHTHCIIFLTHFAWCLHSSRQITTRFAWECK